MSTKETFDGGMYGVRVLPLESKPVDPDDIEIRSASGSFIGGWEYQEDGNRIVKIHGTFPPGDESVVVSFEQGGEE